MRSFAASRFHPVNEWEGRTETRQRICEQEERIVSDTPFKIGMYLGELRLPLEAAMAKAAEIGAESVWYDRLPGDSPMVEMTDQEADRVAELGAEHDLEIFAVGASGSFKKVHLCDLDAERLDEHPDFVRELKELTRAMQIAKRLGVSTVSTFTFAWPGEYIGGKPT